MKTFLQGAVIVAFVAGIQAVFAGLVLVFGSGALAVFGETDNAWIGFFVGLPALAITLWVVFRFVRFIDRRPLRGSARGRA